MKNRSTKRALALSFISLLLCASMFVGTTFAWFTDSVSSTNNIIKSGNLDVELYWSTDAQNWDKVDADTNVFTDELWEPGHTEVVYLKVVNEGTLALKYQLGVNIESETGSINVKNEPFLLSDHLVFSTINITDAVVGNTFTAYSREEAVAKAGTVKGIKAYNSGTKTLEKTNDADYVAMVVYMPTTVGNEANYAKGAAVPTINLGINLFATQQTAESDSFGPDYDEDAWVDGFQVYSADDLQDAINNGQSAIKLMADIEATEAIVIPEGAKVTLNLNEKTIKNSKGYVIENKGDVIIGNGTLAGLGGIRATAGKVTIENGNFFAASRWQDGVYQHTLKAENATVVINGGNFDATVNGQTNAMFNASTNAVITINGGNFKNVAGELGQFDPYIFTYEKNGKVVINDGTFNGGWRFNGETATTDIYGGDFTVGYDGQSFHANSTHVVTVYGGTFVKATNAKLTDKVPSLVAAGYKAVANNGKYVVVAESVDAVVSTLAELTEELEKAAAAGAGDTTIFLAGDIDLGGAAWTPIKVDGYHGADIVTVEGNGATIKGLSAPLFAGGFAGKSGIVIKDLTIADSNIVSTNTIGSGAFIESIDSMATITLTNCHLVNSTVTGGNGSRTGGLIGWTAGYNNVNDGPVKTYVTITNCSVIGNTIQCNGSVGAINGHAGNNAWTYTTITDCVVKNNKLISTDDGGWRVGVVVGTANVGEVTISKITESGNTLTQTGKTAPVGQSNLYGRFVPGTTGKLVIDGASVLAAATSEALSDAIVNGETNVYLPAGNYKMPENNLQGKTLTITGTKDTVIDMTAVDERNQFVTGATIVFDGVTLNFGTANYMGLANTASLTYKNCQINGLQFLYGENVTFENCDLNSNGAEHCVWTYGAKNVTFTECDFTYGDRGINCYSDNDVTGGKQTVNFTNCTFATENTASEGAVEINSCFFSVGIEVNMDGCTAPAYGKMAYVSRWDSTNGAKTTINIK